MPLHRVEPTTSTPRLAALRRVEPFKSVEPAVDATAPCRPGRAPNDEFEAFVSTHRTALLQALVARYGVDAGAEATASALAWAWENRADVSSHTNPVGYLYRVGQSSLRKRWEWNRRSSAFPAERVDVRVATEADLADGVDLAVALRDLSPQKRTAVLLVHAHGWSYADVAAVLGISVAAVTNHVHRGMRQLRGLLKVDAQ